MFLTKDFIWARRRSGRVLRAIQPLSRECVVQPIFEIVCPLPRVLIGGSRKMIGFDDQFAAHPTGMVESALEGMLGSELVEQLREAVL